MKQLGASTGKTFNSTGQTSDATKPATGKAPFQTFVQLCVAWEEDEGPDLKGKTEKKLSLKVVVSFFGGDGERVG